MLSFRSQDRVLREGTWEWGSAKSILNEGSLTPADTHLEHTHTPATSRHLDC